jgi:phage baseplate assembly protein W
MPFNPQQIAPVDLNPNVAVGVNIPFSGPSVFTPNYTTPEAIKNNLINFFLTNPGERPLNPTYGGGLKSFIFTQIAEDNIIGLKSNVELKMERYFPYINIESLEVLRNDDENSLIVKLLYSIKSTNITDNLTFEF